MNAIAEPLTAANQEEQFLTLPANVLKPNPFNNRRHYEEGPLRALAADMKAQGQSQPCVVRPIGNGTYEISAGHRRHRAAILAFGEAGPVKCIVREMTDAQMHSVAMSENLLREDPSVIDEAEGAKRMLDLCEGDRETAAAHLHWSVDKLDRRLALLALSAPCRQALAEKKLSLGIAELLATQPESKQDKALPVILEKKLSVEDVRNDILRRALPLAAAIFRKEECVPCPFNSDRQAGLFDQSIGSGNCTNPVCYRKKTLAVVSERAEELKARFPRVIVIEAKDTPRGLPLSDAELGAEQVTACKGCANFGATVSNLPGEYGAVTEGVCLDADCNGKKKAAYQVKLRAEAKAKAKEKAKADEEAAAKARAYAAAQAGSEEDAEDPTSKPDDEPAPAVTAKASASGVRNAIKEYRVKVWRKAIRVNAERKPVEARIALLALAADHQASLLDNESIHEFVGSAHGLAAILKVFDSTTVEPAITEAVACAAAKAQEVSLPALLGHFGCDLSEVFVADSEFLNLLTRSELESYAEETGLKARMGDDWKKAAGGKKEALVTAMLAVSGFDYTAVPSLLMPTPAN